MEDRRQKIMQSAIRGVRQFGLEGLSMKVVSGLSGANVSIIYTLFNNKEDLLRCCFEEIDRRIAEIFQRVRVEPLDVQREPEREIRRVWTGYYRYLVEHPDETVFYIRYRSTVSFAEYDRMRDRSHYRALLETARLFDGQYHIFSRIQPELLWFHFLTNTAAWAKHVVEGLLPNDAQTQESIFQLELRGLCGMMKTGAALRESVGFP